MMELDYLKYILLQKVKTEGSKSLEERALYPTTQSLMIKKNHRCYGKVNLKEVALPSLSPTLSKLRKYACYSIYPRILLPCKPA